jgi:aspartyl/asparaginyl beta-hydroxylase (cupin superfamily)
VLKQEVPSWQSLSNDPQVQQGNSWKTFVFMAYGKQVASNCSKCPKTFDALQQIDGVQTAWFSILSANTHLPPHEGPFNGILRYHLGLIIPSFNEKECGIRVGNETRTWKEGDSLIFDDTHDHEAWNRTNAKRVVLFVDFIRPLPFPLNVMNKFVVGVAGSSTFIKKIIERAENN